jgi:hypothetical protein
MSARRIKVQAVAGHPVSCPERHLRRPSPMWDEPVPLFPDWFTAPALAPHFAVVDSGGDVVVTTTGYHMGEAEIDRITALRAGRPLVVIFTLDDFREPRTGGWDRSESWAQTIREFVLSADLVAGPQLPVDLDHPRCLPLPYGSLVPPGPQPSVDELRRRPTDVYFSGAWREPEPGVLVPPRDRRFRGRLVRELHDRCADLALEVDKVHFWRTNPRRPGHPVATPPDKSSMLRAHARGLDATRLALAPPGHALYTARHSDVLTRGAGLLTFDVASQVQVPRPDLWASGRIGFEFGADPGELDKAVRRALADLDRLAEVARRGWQYAREFIDPASQAASLAAEIRALG